MHFFFFNVVDVYTLRGGLNRARISRAGTLHSSICRLAKNVCDLLRYRKLVLFAQAELGRYTYLLLGPFRVRHDQSRMMYAVCL